MKKQIIATMLLLTAWVGVGSAQSVDGGVEINAQGGGTTPGAGSVITAFMSAFEDVTVTYDGSVQAFDALLEYIYTGSDGTTYGPSATAPTDSGTYSVQIVSPGATTNSLVLTINGTGQAAVVWSDFSVMVGDVVDLSSQVSGGSGTGAYRFGEVADDAEAVALSGAGNSSADFSAGWTSGDDADKGVLLQARRDGDGNYSDSAYVEQSITVSKAQPTLTWADAEFDGAGGSTNIADLVSVDFGTGAWTYSAGSDCAVVGGTLTWESYKTSETFTVSAVKIGDQWNKTVALVNTYSVEQQFLTIAKTGQTTSYVTNDDGTYQSGVDWASPRFTNHGDGTVTDNNTGLMWEQAPTSSIYTWATASSYGDGLSQGGHTDWRLPTVRELRSMVNYSASDPSVWLNANGFTGVTASYYWSSTTNAFNTSYAWIVDMGVGYVGNGSKGASSNQVWAVRGPNE